MASSTGGLILAIDGGSQSTKVTVFDALGTVRAQGRAPLRASALGPGGRVVHPGDDLWDSLCAGSRAALADLASSSAAVPAAEPIVAIGLCGIRYCRALMDEAGHLTEPVLSWMDSRVSRPAADLDPRVATIAGAAGYLTARLTGQRRDSAAAYKGMWPIDEAGLAWSRAEEDFERTGMPGPLLPELVQPGELLGSVSPAGAAMSGLPAGCPVFATANDKAVEALGAGLCAQVEATGRPGNTTPAGTVLLSLGTYIASMTAGSSTQPHPAAGGPDTWVNSASVPGDVLYESKGIRRGMWTVSWLRHLVSSAAPSSDPEQTQAWLEQGGSDIPPGSEGLFVVPDWLAGPERPERRGSILGLAGQHGPHHLHRAVLEGIALTMREHAFAMIKALDIDHPQVVVSGGGARSDLMMRIVADSWGLVATRAGMPDAAGLGSAMCAAVGAGIYPDFPAAIASMVHPGREFLPEPAAVQAYLGIAAQHRSLTGFTDPMYRRIREAAPCTGATSPG